MAASSQSDNFYFLNGGGEMGSLVRSFNWDKTPLGNPSSWPQSLKTTLSILLNSKFPMFLYWGPEHICFYNDAYRPSLGEDGKHPLLLGARAIDGWGEIWEMLKPIIDNMLATGEANFSEDQLVPIYRNGQMEDVYWTFSYSPVADETGNWTGIFVTCTETTSKVNALKNLNRTNKLLIAAREADEVARRKLKENEHNLRLVILQAPVAIAIFKGPDYIVEIVNARALELWGRQEEEVINKPILKILSELESQGIKDLLDNVYKNGNPFSAAALPVQLNRNGQMQTAFIDFVYEPLYDTGGQINRIITIGTEVTQRVLARKDIEESEERFRTMAEGTAVLVAVADETGKATYFNKAWMDITGRSLADFLDYGWADMVHPEDRQRYLDIYQGAFERKVAFTGEFRLLGKDGNYRWLLGQGSPRFRPDDGFAGYISSNIDITERKTAELEVHRQQRELTDSEGKLDQIISQLPAPIVLLSGPNHVIERANQSILSFWNRSKAQVTGKPMIEVFPELEGQPFPGIWKHVYETGESISNREMPVTFKAPDGGKKQFYVDYYYQPLKDSEGDITGVLATVIDVTENVEARREVHAINEELASSNEELATTNEELAETQESLQRTISKLSDSEAKLMQSINTGRMGTWSIDPETYVVTMSGFVRDLLGLPMNGDVSVDDVMRSVDPEYHEMLLGVLKNAMDKQQPSDTEYSITNLISGETKWVRATGQIFLDADGKAAEYSGMFMDITERKLDELRKSDFIGMVSHELKTPLTSLTALVQVLNAKFKHSDDTFVAGALDKANIQVRKMSSMINGFLNISRLESGKIYLNLQLFDLKQLIGEAIDEIKLTTASHDFVFAACDSVIINADREKIGSVISNLLSNAVKYSPKGKEVIINCERIGDKVRVSVKDEGIGVRQQDIKHLFERYYRVESSKTRHISGFGIGLYLSAEIISRHDGEIGVNSEHGKGSIFYFELPVG